MFAPSVHGQNKRISSNAFTERLQEPKMPSFSNLKRGSQ